LLEGIHPNILSLTAAVLIAVARVLYQGALGYLSPTAITCVVNVVSLVFAFFLYWMSEGVDRWPIQGILWFVAVGLFGSLLGRYFSFVSQRLVGISRTSVVMQSVLVWSTAFGVFFLGERLDAGIIVGSLLIMLGGALLVHEQVEVRKEIPLIYYLAPLLTALSFAVTFLLRRYGLAWIPSAPVGMGIGNFSAIVVIGGILCFSKQGTSCTQGGGSILFALGGSIFNVAAAFCFWIAIQTGELVQVVPINRLSVLFVIFFSWLFFRKKEAITWRVVLGGVLSVAGAFTIVPGK